VGKMPQMSIFVEKMYKECLGEMEEITFNFGVNGVNG
jgi:hypothetical protein